MQEPRAVTKSLSRPHAIASPGVHLCRLKKSRSRVDANKKSYREELYPGKTRRAHINHYQCRSFTHWMGKVERGEVGALPEDPAQEWRFSREGCMRHFVTNIACGKNEFVDTSALRYAEPVKLYLAALRNGHDAEKREDNAVCETASSARSADMSLGSEALTSQDAAEGSEP